MKKELVAGVLLALGTGGSGFAEETTPQYQMNEVIVTATATPVEVRNSMADVTVITREQIEAGHFRNVYELLENIPGVNTRLYGNAVGFELSWKTAPTLRGAKAIFLIDGVDQSSDQTFRGGGISINTDDIERVEIYKGSASTIYGANAIGGVINVITRKHYDKPQTKLEYNYGSYGYNRFNVNTQGEIGKSFWALQLSKNYSGDYKDGHGENVPNNVNANDINLKYGYRVSDTVNVIAKYDSHRQNMSWENKHPAGDSAWGNHNIDAFTFLVDYQSIDGKTGNTFSFIHSKLDSKRYYLKDLGRDLTDYTRYNITDRYFQQIGNHRISAGYSFNRYNDAYSIAGNRDEHAIYVQDEWDITDKWNFIMGIRRTMPSDYADKFTKEFHLGYKINDKVNVYAGSSEYYIPPSSTAAYGDPNNNVVPNHDLSPTTGRTDEIGINAQLNGKTTLNANIFRRIEDGSIGVTWLEPDHAHLGDPRIYRNVEGGSHYKGIELNLSTRIGDYLYANLGYFKMNIGERSSLTTALPGRQYIIGLSYRRENFDVNLYGNARYNITHSKSMKGGPMLPEDSYWLWDLSANYQITPQVKIFGKINNLMDLYYTSSGDYYEEYNDILQYTSPGRNYMLGVSYTF